jgi:hypothetical protein
MSMTQEEVIKIIQNLNKEELEFALHNAKQQVEVINEGLKTTESRTKLLISFLVAAIAFCIPVFVSCENPAYFRLFCGLVIASYIIEVLIIVHCYFLKGVKSATLNSTGLLAKLYEYRIQHDAEKTIFYVKRNELCTILIKSIPEFEEICNTRVEIFNCCLLSIFWFPILFGAIAIIVFICF